MKSIKEVMKKTAKKAAQYGAGSASNWGFYQPKEPQGLQKLKRK